MGDDSRQAEPVEPVSTAKMGKNGDDDNSGYEHTGIQDYGGGFRYELPSLQ